MKSNIKKIVAIHDLSGFGRASLMNIIPVLSTMGMQVCPIPTAILSTHSGGFKEYTFHDLTDVMEGYIAHWEKMKLKFEGIYSGFLGSSRQIEIVIKAIDTLKKKDTIVVVDPVMGDGGKLYSSVSKDMIPEMKKLIGKADIISPNFTEAAFLLGEKQRDNISLEEIKDWLNRLGDMGPKTIIITSAPNKKTDKVDTIAYEKDTKRYWRVSVDKLPRSYPGTGDIFASVMLGSILQGDSLPIAMDRAVQFISQCIQSSMSYDDLERDGVLLERELHLLRHLSMINGFEEI